MAAVGGLANYYRHCPDQSSDNSLSVTSSPCVLLLNSRFHLTFLWPVGCYPGPFCVKGLLYVDYSLLVRPYYVALVRLCWLFGVGRVTVDRFLSVGLVSCFSRLQP
jgi:hypothetical protein